MDVDGRLVRVVEGVQALFKLLQPTFTAFLLEWLDNCSSGSTLSLPPLGVFESPRSATTTSTNTTRSTSNTTTSATSTSNTTTSFNWTLYTHLLRALVELINHALHLVSSLVRHSQYQFAVPMRAGGVEFFEFPGLREDGGGSESGDGEREMSAVYEMSIEWLVRVYQSIRDGHGHGRGRSSVNLDSNVNTNINTTTSATTSTSTTTTTASSSTDTATTSASTTSSTTSSSINTSITTTLEQTILSLIRDLQTHSRMGKIFPTRTFVEQLWDVVVFGSGLVLSSSKCSVGVSSSSTSSSLTALAPSSSSSSSLSSSQPSQPPSLPSPSPSHSPSPSTSLSFIIPTTHILSAQETFEDAIKPRQVALSGLMNRLHRRLFQRLDDRSGGGRWGSGGIKGGSGISVNRTSGLNGSSNVNNTKKTRRRSFSDVDGGDGESVSSNKRLRLSTGSAKYSNHSNYPTYSPYSTHSHNPSVSASTSTSVPGSASTSVIDLDDIEVTDVTDVMDDDMEDNMADNNNNNDNEEIQNNWDNDDDNDPDSHHTSLYGSRSMSVMSLGSYHGDDKGADGNERGEGENEEKERGEPEKKVVTVAMLRALTRDLKERYRYRTSS
ncbi:hypothetical protein F5051DRAFT_47321 [Lentinula edodes]|nr:hypothetical protein F5051DRAFT_47321 [Lentinula edodes]